MSTQRDHVEPLLEEIPFTSSGEEVDPKVLDLAMKIAERMFLKMKEEDAKKKAEEEESRRKAEEDKGKGTFDYREIWIHTIKRSPLWIHTITTSLTCGST